jgi:hypothetical protein
MTRPCLLFFLLFFSLPAGNTQSPSVPDSTRRPGLEDIFRSSDHDRETPTGKSERRRKSGIEPTRLPRGAFRVGCICMDDAHRITRGIGSCSGHGGVRFWIYRTNEGDTIKVYTPRHYAHPNALDAAEMSAIAQKRDQKTEHLRAANRLPVPSNQQPTVILPAPTEHGYFGWTDVVAISIGSITIFMTVRMLLYWMHHHEDLVRYALRHLLRHRKRPPSGKDGETP